MDVVTDGNSNSMLLILPLHMEPSGDCCVLWTYTMYTCINICSMQSRNLCNFRSCRSIWGFPDWATICRLSRILQIAQLLLLNLQIVQQWLCALRMLCILLQNLQIRQTVATHSADCATVHGHTICRSSGILWICLQFLCWSEHYRINQ